MSRSTIKIPAELFALAESSRFEGTLDVATLAIGPDDYRFSEPLAWQVDITNTGAAFLVAGQVTGTGLAACSRCLEDATFEFNGDIEGYFLIGDSTADDYVEEGEELGDDEFETLPDDHVIDMEPLICAALIVDAPTVPLCREDCQGLCPQCGANLNEGDCGCARDDGFEDNPFAVLANYKFD